MACKIYREPSLYGDVRIELVTQGALTVQPSSVLMGFALARRSSRGHKHVHVDAQMRNVDEGSSWSIGEIGPEDCSAGFVCCKSSFASVSRQVGPLLNLASD